MIEKFNRLLDDEQQLVLKMAELYVHASEKKLAISDIQNELGISRHQALATFDLLEFTIEALGIENVDLLYDGKGLLSIYGLTTFSVKMILEELAVKSIRLNVFINSQLGIYGTQGQFLKKFGISRATYYRNIINIRQIFADDFFNRKTRNEEYSRQVIFSVIHHFFSGIDTLPGKFQDEIHTLIDQICRIEKIELSYTERKRLINFMFVQANRIDQGYIVEGNYFTGGDDSKLLALMGEIWPLSDDDLKQETTYLAVYLAVNDLAINRTEENWDDQLHTAINAVVERQMRGLTQLLKLSKIDGQLKRVQCELKQINIKIFSPFYFSETFVDPVKVPFFSETYPEIDEIVKQLLLEISKEEELLIDKDTLTQMYYAYMLVMLEYIPTNLLSDVVRITVDFSNGRLFTKYIQTQLQQFAPLNIEVTDQLDSKTDIFLSDQSFHEINCEQMIWESPPLAEDWELLGDLIIKIKKKRKDKQSR